MYYLKSILFVTFFMTSAVVANDNVNNDKKPTVTQKTYILAEHEHHVQKVLLGCTASHDTCHHEASSHGYRHATLKYNEHVCTHHPHMACYAW